MADSMRNLDSRTRQFFGGPRIGFLAFIVAFAFVVPGIGKINGLDEYGMR